MKTLASQITVTVLISAFSTSAFAAKDSENVIIMKKPSQSAQTLMEGSSAANRVGKTFSISGQLMGIGPGATATRGLTFGYHLNRNQLIQIEATSGGLQSGLDASETKTQSFGAHFKHFVGNSFYYRAGIDHSIVKHYAIYSRSTTSINGVVTSQEEASGRFEGTMTGATLVIGNQWQWENFTLGCDWVGITQPLVSQISSQSVKNMTYTPDASEKLQSDQQSLLKGTLPHLVRFYLGATF